MDIQEPESGPVKKVRGNSEGGAGEDQSASADVNNGDTKTVEKAEGEVTDSPRLVERMTALRGQNIGFGRVEQSTIRKRTERDLRLPDAEVPCFKTEKAIRDLVCSLMERQDRMNEAIFLRINDLEYRVDDVEQSRKPKVTKQKAAVKVKRE